MAVKEERIKIQIYHQARGSVAEVQNFLTLARDLKMIGNDAYEKLQQQADESRRLINGLIRSIHGNDE